MRDPHLPSHYAWALLGVLIVSVSAVAGTLTAVGASQGSRLRVAPFVPFFVLGAGFMILETKAITQFALIWGSTWVVASADDRVGTRDGRARRLACEAVCLASTPGSWARR